MANDLVRAQPRWNVNVMDLVPRVSGTELGRRLEYYVSKPTTFNEKVVAKHIKNGNLNDFDIVEERRQCKKGFGVVEILEYWLTLKAALKVAMHVRTPAAEEIRNSVIEDLIDLSLERGSHPIVPTDPMAAFMAGVIQALNNQTTTLKALIQPVTNASAPEVIDAPHITRLRALARAVAKAETKAKGKRHSFTQVWLDVLAIEGFDTTGRAFSTVTWERLPAVRESLRLQLVAAANLHPKSPEGSEPGLQIPEASNPDVWVNRPWKEKGDLSMAEVLELLKAKVLTPNAWTPKDLFPSYLHYEAKKGIQPRIEKTPLKSGPKSRPLLFLSPQDAERYVELVQRDLEKPNGHRSKRPGPIMGDEAP